MSSQTQYIRGRGSISGGFPNNSKNPPHVILPITPTPPPLPPPPPNPQLKPRSYSQQWASSKIFGLNSMEKLPVRSQSVKTTPQKRSNAAPPRPLTIPKLIEEGKSRLAAPQVPAPPGSSPQSPTDTHTASPHPEVMQFVVGAIHSTVLVVSYLLWVSFLILLLPAICTSYCFRQIGLLVVQHRRPALVETLSSPSLNYLKRGDEDNLPAVNVVAIYLGNPGIRLSALKRLLSERILKPSDETPRTCQSRQSSERWLTRRLQQSIVELPTGFAWQRCTSINMDDHVVPAYLVGQNQSDLGRRLSPKKYEEDEGLVGPEKDPVEMLIGRLSTLALPIDRPLWQVHLVEDYYDNKNALTVRRTQSPFSSPNWQKKDYLTPFHRSCSASKSPLKDGFNTPSTTPPWNSCQPSPRLPKQSSSRSPTSSVGGSTFSRSGSGGRLIAGPPNTGSLIIFRVHAAITDDAQGLVEFITVLLSEGIFNETRANVNIPTNQLTGLSKTRADETARREEVKQSSISPLFKVRLSESSLEWSVLGEAARTSQPPSSAAAFHTYSNCFCTWLREVQELRREAMRAVFLGSFVMLHNLMLVSADRGLFPSRHPHPPPSPDRLEGSGVVKQQVFRRIQLPLEKLMHIQKVTKATFAEISMSLLSGALRAYQQTSGLQSPPDLLVRACTPTRNFELCCERLFHLTRRRELDDRHTGSSNAYGGGGRQEALNALTDIANGPPAECVFAPFRLPLDVEGMLPRLWRVRQRLRWIQRSSTALTLAWTREFIHLLLPHWLAVRVSDMFLGGAVKCSLTYAEVSLEGTGSVESTATTSTYQRRLGKKVKSGQPKRSKQHYRFHSNRFSRQSSSKMDISQALRLVNNPESTGGCTSTECGASTGRNLDLIYLAGGVPIVRIEAWLACDPTSATSGVSTTSTSPMCREVAVVSCIYGSHLTVGITAGQQLNGTPGIEFILNAMLHQLNQLHKLLNSRFPAKSVIYAPSRCFNLTSGGTKMSPNPNRLPRDPPESPTTSSRNPTQLTTATILESNALEIMVGGELIESAQYLKYNFPPISSGLRRTSFKRSQKRHSNGFGSVKDCSEIKSKALKLMPILRVSGPSMNESAENSSDDVETVNRRQWIDKTSDNEKEDANSATIRPNIKYH